MSIDSIEGINNDNKISKSELKQLIKISKMTDNELKEKIPPEQLRKFKKILESEKKSYINRVRNNYKYKSQLEKQKYLEYVPGLIDSILLKLDSIEKVTVSKGVEQQDKSIKYKKDTIKSEQKPIDKKSQKQQTKQPETKQPETKQPESKETTHRRMIELEKTLDVISKQETSEDIEKNLRKKLERMRVFIKVLESKQGKKVEFTKEEEKIRQELEKYIKNNKINISRINIQSLKQKVKDLEKDLKPTVSYNVNEKDKNKESKKGEFSKTLGKFSKFLKEHGFESTSEKLDEIIKKINSKDSVYAKGLDALKKGLNIIEKLVAGDLSYVDMIKLVKGGELKKIVGDIQDILWELVGDAAGLLIGFVRDLSVKVIGLTEISDPKDGVLVKKLKNYKKRYNTGLSFIDNRKNAYIDEGILVAAASRGGEEAIFDMLSGIGKVKVDITKSVMKLGSELSGKLMEIIPKIIDSIPKIIGAIKEGLKEVFKTITNLKKEDWAYLAGYIAAYFFFPLKEVKDYVGKGIEKILGKFSSKLSSIIGKVEEIFNKSKKIPENLKVIAKKAKETIKNIKKAKENVEKIQKQGKSGIKKIEKGAGKIATVIGNTYDQTKKVASNSIEQTTQGVATT